jgi:L-lactate dehydrogenase
MSAHTIAIIGAGSVGSTIAHTLILRRVVGDLILVDIDDELCRAQVDDLSDGTFLSDVRIRQGTLEDARKAEITIVTAGAKQRPGDTRLDLIDRNYKVLHSVLAGMQPMRPDAVLLLVANPVDVLTAMAQKMAGLPREQVLGSGTLLDSVRLTRMLAHRLKVRLRGMRASACANVEQVADRSVHATIIGEHGDSQCVSTPRTVCYNGF